MSTQVTTSFSQQFSTNVMLLSQQKGSLLRKAVREESVTGEKGFFDQIGKAQAVKTSSRHAKHWRIRLRSLIANLVNCLGTPNVKSRAISSQAV